MSGKRVETNIRLARVEEKRDLCWYCDSEANVKYIDSEVDGGACVACVKHVLTAEKLLAAANLRRTEKGNG